MAVLPVGISGEEGGYQIERSLRFNSADSAYLSRTPSGTGGRSKFTYSFWLKITKPSTQIFLLSAPFSTTQNGSTISIESSGQFYAGLRLYNTGSQGTFDAECYSNMLFRDPSAWYHIVFSLDTTAASADAMKLYVNGVSQSFASYDAPTASAVQYIGSEFTHYIGRLRASTGTLDGYMTEVYFIDGSALTASDFGEFNTDTGVWQPKAYEGSYGTNGFYLDFADNSSTTALGYDAAGSNDWTPNNFSVTAGAGNDSLVDTPTQYGTDTGAGGEVRGNYCTWNPLADRDSITAPTFSNGNLDAVFPSGLTQYLFGTLPLPTSGKWYWEATVTTLSAGAYMGIGFDTGKKQSTANDQAVMYGSNGNKTVYATNTSYGATFTTGDVIGVALNMDSLEVTFYKNNSSQGTITGLTSLSYTPHVQGADSSAVTLNAGQRPFAYTAPSGFKALCTTNLPEPTIADGGEYFNTVLYTGNGSTQSITGVGFQPDFVWLKARSAGGFDHVLQDVIRGSTYQLYTNTTDAEVNDTDAVTSFNSDGFTSGADVTTNNSGTTFVAWNWKANGSGVSNTDGSITSTVSANTTSGFSIVTYSGTDDRETVGHGLGVAPSMIIFKRINNTANWCVYHKSIGATKYLELSTTIAATTSDSPFNDTDPTSTVFSIYNAGLTGAVGSNYVAYCFAPVEGFSAFGSYTGNGSTDGPFIFTGFRPRWIMVKQSSAAGENWEMWDSERGNYNINTPLLYANLSNAETSGTAARFDTLSNGFKVRSTNAGVNASGATYIYAAFAENPFKYSLGR